MNRLSKLADRMERGENVHEVAEILREAEELLSDLDADLERALGSNPSFIVRAVINRKRERIRELLT